VALIPTACSEHLGIPEAEYDATVKVPSSEFQRIVKDLASIGDTGALSGSLCFVRVELVWWQFRACAAVS
jgi:hypothetical protein